MSDPVPSHLEELHLTSTSAGALSGATKLDETSKVSISTTATTVDRLNLNSDGYAKVSSTFKALSGSLDFRVVRDSTVQALVVAGTTAFLHVITNAAAGSGETKGYRYEVVFENLENSWEAGALVGGTASFKVNGAPTEILGT